MIMIIALVFVLQRRQIRVKGRRVYLGMEDFAKSAQQAWMMNRILPQTMIPYGFKKDVGIRHYVSQCEKTPLYILR